MFISTCKENLRNCTHSPYNIYIEEQLESAFYLVYYLFIYLFIIFDEGFAKDNGPFFTVANSDIFMTYDKDYVNNI